MFRLFLSYVVPALFTAVGSALMGLGRKKYWF